ncbi:MAG: 50S ribosomal protein L3 [Bacillota bacterium]|jgi:large subunit ribosomal protein L3|nr:50S ribosomal protein L3 [Bacillota bacterium]MDI9414931.1 50S ribosomal protein L3 [Bacillota bacterium]NLD12127.1 50S ribosomal protein L3 [Bacillota bacterium]HAV21806.1 50S ribosomal protein L3 [Bacillota bacterium]HCD41369.1 50S ribosomal protein L3 [Bacillota bacterium]
MAKGILGKKLGMTQIFTDDGHAIPVTVIEAGPCVVVQKKAMEKDGYYAIQLGFGDIRERLVNKPDMGHFKRHKVRPVRYLREFRASEDLPHEVGSEIKADIFSEGDLVDITGTSIGKGFAGAIKRWNFRRGPMSHGSMYHRRPGALGATGPARVLKGRKLPGRLGGERVTIQNLKVVKVDPERNLMLVKGSVPGRRGSLLIIREAVKSRAAKNKK